jgi:hypothetical protein
MRHISLLSAAAALAVTALSASTPAKADPFHLIRWMDTIKTNMLAAGACSF